MKERAGNLFAPRSNRKCVTTKMTGMTFISPIIVFQSSKMSKGYKIYASTEFKKFANISSSTYYAKEDNAIKIEY